MECVGGIMEILKQFTKALFGAGAGETLLSQLSGIPKLNDSLYEFYSPADGVTPNVEIIFFHGLQWGDYKKAFVETWTTSDGSTSLCWPKEWLAEVFPKARILSVSYDSSAIQGNTQGRVDLFCTAENLIQDLMNVDGKVAKTNNCPLILVGQDVGGLIIKAICMKADKDKDKNATYQSFLTNIKGVLYYSTPHLGFSRWPSKFNGALAKNLGLLNVDIGRLNQDFAHLRAEKKWVAKQLVAALPSKEPLFDVPEASARIDVDTLYTTQEDIDTICKPRARTSVSFTYLTGLISDCIGSARGKSIKWKSSLPFVEDSHYVPMQRTIESVQIALKSAHIVVLHGGPGQGKSSLARYLALWFQEEQIQGLRMASTSDQVSGFSDGVFYLTCGKGAHTITKQRELLRLFEVEVSFQDAKSFGDEDFCHMLHKNLVEHLQDRKALVIVDDVWDSDRDLLQNILVPGTGLKYLVTTQVSTLWIASDSKTIRMEDVNQEDGRKILANYAKFDGGVIPRELENLADLVIEATESHPLALATLGLVMNSGNRTSKHEWQELKDNLSEYLMTTDYPAILFGARYPLPVHASMMFMLGDDPKMLEDDAKMLLQIIVLFRGPRILESLVRLFIMYTQPQGSPMKINVSRKSLEAHGLVGVEQVRYSTNRTDDWRALTIHGLRQHFILTTRMEDIKEFTRFLDGDETFLHEGKRSNLDLATVLCALYGVAVVQQRAVEKMGMHFIWLDFDRLDLLADDLRIMTPFMFVEGENTSRKTHIAKAATEVFWKVFSEGKLDDLSMSALLDLPECTKSSCTFLRELGLTFQGTHHELSTEAFPQTISKLLFLLLNNVEEAVQLQATSTIQALALSSQNKNIMRQVPSFLEGLLSLLASHVAKTIQEHTMCVLVDLAKCGENQIKIDILATQGLLQILVNLLSKDQEGRCKGAVETIRHLGLAPENGVLIVQFPSCLERLVGLLAQDVDNNIQEHAVCALANLAGCDGDQVKTDILATSGLLQSLNMLLYKDMEGRCDGAARTIYNLAHAKANQIAIVQFPFFLKRLAGLLAQDVDKSVQVNAMGTLANLASCDENQIKIDILATQGLLESLVLFLCKDMEERCRGAAMAIRNLGLASANMVLIVQFPSCLKRLVELLAEDVNKEIQENAVCALANLASCVEDQIKIEILATPGLLQRAVMLLSKDMEGRCEGAAMMIRNLGGAPVNSALIVQFPSYLERLVGLIMAQDVDKRIQENAVCALANVASGVEDQIKIEILAIQGLLQSLVMLLCKDMEGRCKGAAMTLSNLGLAPANSVCIVKFPSCLERLAGLLAQDVDKSIQEHAVGALANLAVCDGDQIKIHILATPGLLHSLVMLLSKEMEGRCKGATRMIRLLGHASANQAQIAQYPFCLERLVGLLAGDVEKSIQEDAVYALENLASLDEDQIKMGILATDGLLPSLVMLLSNDMDGKCKGAAAILYHLGQAFANRILLVQFPSCLERLVGLLSPDLDRSIQEVAVYALSNLANYPEDQVLVDILSTQGLLQNLVMLLSKDLEGRCKGATRTIRLLGRVSANQVQIAQFPFCLERLVGLLAGDVEKSIQEEAVYALRNLASFDEDQIKMDILATDGLLQNLVMFLSNDMGDRCKGAATTIYHLGLASINKVLIAQFPSCLERLVGLLAEDVDKSIQGTILWVLIVLLKSSTVNCVLIWALLPGLLGRLVNLLSDRELCKGATRTIHSLAAFQKNSVVIVQFPGVIDGLIALMSEQSNVDESIQEVVAIVIANLVLVSEKFPDIMGVLEGLVKNAHVIGTSSSEFYRHWSYVKAKLKDYQGALVDMTKALDLNPNNGFLWQERGVLLRLMGDLPGALADLNKALGIDADDYEILKHRGMVKYMMEDKDGARADAERAIQVRPSQVATDSYGEGCCFGVLSVEFLNYTL